MRKKYSKNPNGEICKELGFALGEGHVPSWTHFDLWHVLQNQNKKWRHYENLFGSVPPFDKQSGVWQSPLSRLCQTPKVVNPRVMITTAVVLRNSINKPLSDGPDPVLSIMGLLPRPHVIATCNWSTGQGKITLLKLGYQLPKRGILVMDTVWWNIILFVTCI